MTIPSGSPEMITDDEPWCFDCGHPAGPVSLQRNEWAVLFRRPKVFACASPDDAGAGGFSGGGGEVCGCRSEFHLTAAPVVEQVEVGAVSA